MCITGKYVDFDNCWIYKKRKKFKSLKSKKQLWRRKVLNVWWVIIRNILIILEVWGCLKKWKCWKDENVGNIKCGNMKIFEAYKMFEVWK